MDPNVNATVGDKERKTVVIGRLMSTLMKSAALLSCTVAASAALSQYTPETAAERDGRMAWWREARFGMFVHWGLYSGLAGTWDGKPVASSGGMEWIQQRVQADTDTYAQRAIPLFKPAPGFARQWAKLAKEGGARYVVFTTKHHDGFALHDSGVSEFDAGTIVGRDLVKEIVNALRAEGLRVGFYHSVIDWHHDQYEYARSQQLPHPLKGRPYPNRVRNHARYVEFLHAQVNELLSNYGTIDIQWWDYSAQDFQGDEAWRAFDLMALARTRQPRIVMNNRLFRIAEAGWKSMGTEGYNPALNPKYGDFITPEQHIPDTGMPGVDWETCMTMNTTWGYSEHDRAWKSDEALIRNLVEVASKGGNYLLNIGPKGDGSVPEESVRSMRGIGRWLKTNAESIFGTRGGPVSGISGVRTTFRDRTIYFHVLEWPADGRLVVPRMDVRARSARLLGGGPLETEPDGESLIVRLPPRAPDPIASVIAVELDRPVATREGGVNH
jgi:alpha-L-fucosidase